MSADIESVNGHRSERITRKNGTAERVAGCFGKRSVIPIFFSIPHAACEHIRNIVYDSFVFYLFENIYVRVEFFYHVAQASEPDGISLAPPLRF